jgi:hypothetical protein
MQLPIPGRMAPDGDLTAEVREDGGATIACAPGVAVAAPIGGVVVDATLTSVTIENEGEHTRVSLDGFAPPPLVGATLIEGQALGFALGPVGLRVERQTRASRRHPWGDYTVSEILAELARAAVIGA